MNANVNIRMQGIEECKFNFTLQVREDEKHLYDMYGNKHASTNSVAEQNNKIKSGIQVSGNFSASFAGMNNMQNRPAHGNPNPGPGFNPQPQAPG